MPASAEPVAREQRPAAATHDPASRTESRQLRMRLGPLLAVCGLTGGAGTTTLAYLVALAAARQSGEPALVADTGGPSGGLSALAEVETPRSLPELAAQLAAGVPLTGGLYAVGRDGVRVIAARPELTLTCRRDELQSLLEDAREAHGLTVIDCGTYAREADRLAVAAATHVAWVMPATPHAVSRGARVLDAAPPPTGKELLVSRRDVRQSKAPLRALRLIAAERGAPLVLVPHIDSLEHREPGNALEQAQVPIQAILGALRR
jgi:hypothetical protein